MTRPTSGGEVTAVLHRAAGTWRALVGRCSDGAISIEDAREFRAEEASRIDDWLAGKGVDTVIAVVPASAVICRSCPLPNAAEERLEGALGLQAEAHLLSVAPAHRLSMGVIPAAFGETTRSGLILAWPESTRVVTPPVSREITWASDVAALAALVGKLRPSEPLVWIDRSEDAVAVAMSHTNGVTFRATHESLDDDGWRDGVRRVIAETALNAQHRGDFVGSMASNVVSRVEDLERGGAMLVLPSEVREDAASRLAGAGTDDRWWSRFGIAAGVLLARHGGFHHLTDMIDSPPVEAPTTWNRIAGRLSSPRAAVIAVVACLVILGLSPLVMSFTRLSVLRARYPQSARDEVRATVDEVQMVREIYEELDRQAWPMTKLLSDIACNTPNGIKLQMIRLSYGDAFRVSGTAQAKDGLSSRDLILLMQKNLRDSQVFSGVKLEWGQSNAYSGEYEFDLSAVVARPHLDYTYPQDQDFGSWPLVDRINGRGPGGEPTEGAATLATTGQDPVPPVTEPGDEIVARVPEPQEDTELAGAPTGPGAGSGVRPPNIFGEGSSGGNTKSRTELDTGGGVAPSQDIPEPLADAVIASMNTGEARSALARIAKARKHNKDDEALQARYQAEWEKILARMGELRKSG